MGAGDKQSVVGCWFVKFVYEESITRPATLTLAFSGWHYFWSQRTTVGACTLRWSPFVREQLRARGRAPAPHGGAVAVPAAGAPKVEKRSWVLKRNLNSISLAALASFLLISGSGWLHAPDTWRTVRTAARSSSRFPLAPRHDNFRVLQQHP